MRAPSEDHLTQPFAGVLASRRLRVIAPLLMLLVGAALFWPDLLRGWYPADEGALGQSAERLLQGEWPHRDFDEVYTGLLTLIHAAAFKVFGISSAAMRYPLFAATLAWMVGVYAILTRFISPLTAAVGALVALLWSVPNYSAPMPSWYVLFAATLSAYAMIRWTESGRERWLWLAGFGAALAFFFKMNGLLVLCGAGLALIALAAAEPQEPGVATERGVPRWAVLAVLLITVVGLVAPPSMRAGPELGRFVFPVGALTLAVAATIAQREPTWQLSRRTVRAMAALCGGALLPILGVLALYAAGGGLWEFYNDVFLLPFRRTTYAAVRPPSHEMYVYAFPLLALLWLRPTSRGVRWLLTLAAAALAMALVVLSAESVAWYRAGWYAAWALVALVSVEAGRQFVWRVVPNTPRGQAAVILACVGVAISLLEFPYATPIYTAYGWPLAFLAIVALVRTGDRMARETQVVLFVTALAFGGLRIYPGTVASLGHRFVHSRENAVLAIPRGGIKVGQRDSVVSVFLYPVIDSLARGRPVWAGPDAPEIYFYANQRNPTRLIFDFLNPTEQARPLLTRVDEIDPGLVVMKSSMFSPAIADSDVAALRSRYPFGGVIGPYEVRWR